MSHLTKQEQLRYNRQIMLKGIGESGQLKLRNAKVLIVGLGGLGNPVALYLAAAGVGNLVVADGDSIDITNLQRQILFTEQDVNQNKAEVAAEKLHQHSNETSIEVIDEMLDEELCDYYFPLVDIVIDCTDNVDARYLLNHFSIKHQKPLVVGAATGFDGQVIVFDQRQENSACYQCFFPKSETAPNNNCQTVGILGPVLSIIAGSQALQTMKLLTDLPVKHNQLAIFDGLENQWQQFNVTKNENCQACGHR